MLALLLSGIAHTLAADNTFRPHVTVFTQANSDLPGNSVVSLSAASDGALWVGTVRQGIARFEDGEWQVFTEENSGLPSNQVVKLLSTPDGALWVGTWDGGVARFQGGQWQVFNEANSALPYDEVWALSATSDGAVWVATYNRGLARFKDGKWQVFTEANSGLPSDDVRALSAAPDGALWVGTWEGGLARFQGGQWQVYTWANSGLPSNNIVKLLATPDGAVWAGTFEHGLVRFEDGQWQVFTKANSSLPNNDIQVLLATPNGSVWIGTLGGGLARFDDGQWQVVTDKNSSLPNNDIEALSAAPDGALWVGTWQGGLARLEDSQWRVFNAANSDLPNNFVTAVLTTPDDAVWVAPDKGGLIRFEVGERQVFTESNSGLPSNDVRALSASPDGALWVGTSSSGLARFQGGQWQVFNEANSGLPSDKIQALSVGPDGALWVGTSEGGLARFEGGQWQVFNVVDSGLPNASFTVLSAAPDGALWVGTDGDGLARFKDGQWQVFTKANSDLPNNTVTALLVTSDGSVWAGIADSLTAIPDGLVRFDDGKSEVFDVAKSGLPFNGIRTLSATPNGALWVGIVSGGLARFKDGQWQVFTKANSDLPDNDVWALSATSDGAMWVGTTQGGLARFVSPRKRPQIKSFVGKLPDLGSAVISQNLHIFAVQAFDPTHRTPVGNFRYEWNLQHLSSSGEKELPGRVTRSAVFPANFNNQDGRYQVSVTAIDVYGFRSEPYKYEFEVSIPKPDPLLDKIYTWATRLFSGGVVVTVFYLIAIFPLLWLYPNQSWVRTLIDSGALTKLPVLHKLILNSSWARSKLFKAYVLKMEEMAMVPAPYIQQSVFRRGAHLEDLQTLDGSIETLSPILQATGRTIVLGRSGTGKSVLIQFLLRETARRFSEGKTKRVPVYIDLRTHPLGGQSVEKIVCESLASGRVELPSDTIDFLIAKGGFLLLIDSLNEARAEDIRNTFQPFLNRDANNEVILASQNDVLERTDLPVFLLSEVTELQAEIYLTEYTGKSTAWSTLPNAAKALAKNPQDLAIIAEAARNLGDTSKVPSQRAALYREILLQDTSLSNWARSDAMQLQAVYAVSFRMFSEMRTLTAERSGEWVRQAIVTETGKSAEDGMVEECLNAIRNSRLFRHETEIDELGKQQPVISFRHELIGKFLSARYVRRQLQVCNVEQRTDLLAQCDGDTWLDVLSFVIDELESSDELSRLTEELVRGGPSVSMKAAGYALHRKPEMIKKSVRELYTNRKIREDSQEVVPAFA